MVPYEDRYRVGIRRRRRPPSPETTRLAPDRQLPERQYWARRQVRAVLLSSCIPIRQRIEKVPYLTHNIVPVLSSTRSHFPSGSTSPLTRCKTLLTHHRMCSVSRGERTSTVVTVIIWCWFIIFGQKNFWHHSNKRRRPLTYLDRRESQN